ncbi:hypothetical protein RHS02_03113, partial [Rhizoctonia solani]
MMDYVLGVRLCNACRSTEIVKLSYAPEPVWDCVQTSSFTKKHRMTETDFALKSEIDDLLNRLYSLPNDLDHPKVQRCIARQIKSKIERNKHASALIQYAFYAAVEKQKVLNGKKLTRVEEVQSRLLSSGWKHKYIAMIKGDSPKEWNRLVNLHKPITTQVWERLYPKLLRLLKFSKRRAKFARAETRRLDRHKVVEEMLVQTGGTLRASVEMASIGHGSTTNNGTAYMPFPTLVELLDYPVFKDLIETDRSIGATKIKFLDNFIVVSKAIFDWRAGLEGHLAGLVNYGRSIRKRECSPGNEFIGEPAQISSRFTAASYAFITPQNSILFRADSVFLYDLYPLQVVFYPGSFTQHLDKELKRPRSNEDGKSALDSFFSKVKYDTQGAGCAAALLKELGRPDVSHVEMEALGERFICSRCPSRTIHTWTSLISHYLDAYRYAVTNGSQIHLRPRIVFNNVHDWNAWSERPLVRLLNSHEINAHNARTCSIYAGGRTVACRICSDIKVPWSDAHMLTMLHLRYCHDVLQPVVGEHYFNLSIEYPSSDGQILGTTNTAYSGS